MLTDKYINKLELDKTFTDLLKIQRNEPVFLEMVKHFLDILHNNLHILLEKSHHPNFFLMMHFLIEPTIEAKEIREAYGHYLCYLIGNPMLPNDDFIDIENYCQNYLFGDYVSFLHQLQNT
jgi:hypothetical protein